MRALVGWLGLWPPRLRPKTLDTSLGKIGCQNWKCAVELSRDLAHAFTRGLES